MWFAIDMADDSSSVWFYLPMLGTGIAVAITGIVRRALLSTGSQNSSMTLTNSTTPSARSLPERAGALSIATVRPPVATDASKACPGRHCGWAFYDRSLSRTSTWCSMRVCGGREKARAYRWRARARES
jgi:predicted RNA-binding Zn ribbon-like protein